MKKKDESHIIKRIQNGDTDAFEWLVTEYQRPLFVFAANLLPQSHRAEDVVQEVFLAAFKNIGKYNPSRSRFSTWLFRIARNRCLNEIRKKKEKILSTPPEIAGADDPSESLLAKETFTLLDKALETLPVQDRSIFILAEFENLPYLQIAEIEGVKLGTVKSRLSRIRKKLRILLKDVRE